MWGKLYSVPSETPSAQNQPTLPAKGGKRFGKKLYAAVAIAAVAVIVIALLIPQGAAIIPLNVEYTVGERMVYDTTETVAMQIYNSTVGTSLGIGGINNTVTMNSTTTVDVVDFDGETYTLNHTVSMELLGHPLSISFIEKVNKTGYSTLLFPGATQALATNVSSDNPILSGLLGKSEVKVGDTWEIPLNTNNASIGMTGSITLTFKGIQDITVPAGTYKVFRVDMSSNNLGMNTVTASPYGGTTTVSTTMNISGEYYIEYDTGRQIEYNTQMAIQSQVMGVNTTTSLSANTTLVQHIKP
jgi:hypothetical protein